MPPSDLDTPRRGGVSLAFALWGLTAAFLALTIVAAISAAASGPSQATQVACNLGDTVACEIATSQEVMRLLWVFVALAFAIPTVGLGVGAIVATVVQVRECA